MSQARRLAPCKYFFNELINASQVSFTTLEKLLIVYAYITPNDYYKITAPFSSLLVHSRLRLNVTV